MLNLEIKTKINQYRGFSAPSVLGHPYITAHLDERLQNAAPVTLRIYQLAKNTGAVEILCQAVQTLLVAKGLRLTSQPLVGRAHHTVENEQGLLPTTWSS